MPASALVTATEIPASRTAGTAWMWSQCPWVSTTWLTPRSLAQLEQRLVLVGRVDQHGLARSAATQDVDVVVHRADHDVVDLGTWRPPDLLELSHPSPFSVRESSPSRCVPSRDPRRLQRGTAPDPLVTVARVW